MKLKSEMTLNYFENCNELYIIDLQIREVQSIASFLVQFSSFHICSKVK